MKSGFQNCKIAGVGVNAEKYHIQSSERGTADFIVSPSSLKLFMECASRFKAGYAPPDSEAKDWGNLLDVLLLTPREFENRFSVKPATYPADGKKGEQSIEKPWNGNSTWCKEWLESQGDKTVVSQTELTNAKNAVNRLLADETVAAFHAASEKQVHVKGEWHDSATGLIIPVQCLIDFVPARESEFQKSLGDLKSTRNAGQRPFQRWCYTARYHVQAAFDLDLYMAAVNPNRDESGEDRQEWIFILQENFPPFEIGRRMLSLDAIQIGRQTYQDGLARYARCLKDDDWTGYDAPEEFTLLDAEPHWSYESLSQHLEHEQTQPQPPDDGEITP